MPSPSAQSFANAILYVSDSGSECPSSIVTRRTITFSVHRHPCSASTSPGHMSLPGLTARIRPRHRRRPARSKAQHRRRRALAVRRAARLRLHHSSQPPRRPGAPPAASARNTRRIRQPRHGAPPRAIAHRHQSRPPPEPAPQKRNLLRLSRLITAVHTFAGHANQTRRLHARRQRTRTQPSPSASPGSIRSTTSCTLFTTAKRALRRRACHAAVVQHRHRRVRAHPHPDLEDSIAWRLDHPPPNASTAPSTMRVIASAHPLHLPQCSRSRSV